MPLILAGLLAGALFPFGWLGQRWPAFGAWLDNSFAIEATHLIGHLFIFGCLGLALLGAWPALLRRPALYAGLIFAAGVGQELLQKLHKGPAIVANDLFDLGVDMLAGAAAYALAYALARRQGRGER
jgi:hypothetical protein